MRSETGQWMRRSRSPGRKARMSASSVPPPGRVDRCWPTSPTGWGRAAREEKCPGRGTDVTTSRRWSGSTHTKPPRSPNAATWAGPSRRTPHRRDSTPTASGTRGRPAGGSAPCPTGAAGTSSAAAATWPWAGEVRAQWSPGRWPTTSRSPSTASTSRRQVRDSPSRTTRASTLLETRGARRGTVTSDQTTAARSGTPTTATSPRPSPAPSASRTSPSAAARPRARVGRQPPLTPSGPRRAGSARCAGRRRRRCGA